MLDNENVKIGRIIKRLRKSKKISQEELAFNAKISRKYMSSLERELYKPSMTKFINIAHALDMQASDLMKEVETSLNLLKDINKTDQNESNHPEE